MLLVIDNYDSFTYNLVQALGSLGVELTVVRNDEKTLEQLDALHPSRLLVSPGPCTPREAGISMDVIKHYAGKIPVLGVCLGHQCMGEVFGGKVIRASRLMHGKTSPIHHDGKGVYEGLPQDFQATRYHSLVVELETLPDCFQAVSFTADQRELMGIRHKEWPLEGVQFHPESYLCEQGLALLKNFLEGRFFQR
jgi:para-aminobenzoate synthetase component 2